MSTTEESECHAAAEMESKVEEREQARREQGRREDVNQSIQTGTHDSAHLGIKWGPSYKTRRRKSKGATSTVFDLR